VGCVVIKMGAMGTSSLIEFEGHEVRVINEDGSSWDGRSEPWFVPSNIAAAIGASDPSDYAKKILNRNPEKFLGFRGRVNLSLPQGGAQEVNIINENGLYMFLVTSELPRAIAFQRKVTYILKDIRTGKIVKTDNVALQAVKQLVGVVESHDNRIGSMENRLVLIERTVENEVLITNRQATTISFTVKSRIRELLNEENYKRLSRHYFAWIYKEIYARFAVPSYRDIPRSEYAAVLKLIEEWKPVQVVKESKAN